MKKKLSIIGLCAIILIPLLYSFANNNVYGQRIARVYLTTEYYIIPYQDDRQYYVRITRIEENSWYFSIQTYNGFGGSDSWDIVSGLPDRELYVIPVRPGFDRSTHYKLNPHAIGVGETISLEMTMLREKSGGGGLEIALPSYVDFYTTYSINRRHGDMDYASPRTYIRHQYNISTGNEHRNAYTKQENLNVPDGYYVFAVADSKVFAIHRTTGKIIYKNYENIYDMENWYDFNELDPMPVPAGFIPFGVSPINNRAGSMYYGVAAYKKTENSVDIAYRRDIDSDWQIASLDPYPTHKPVIPYSIRRFDLDLWPSMEYQVPRKFTPISIAFREDDIALRVKADYDYQWMYTRFSYRTPNPIIINRWSRSNPIGSVPDMPFADYRLVFDNYTEAWRVIHESLGEWNSQAPNPPSNLQPNNNSYSTSKTVTIRWTYEHPNGVPSSGVRLQRSQYSNFAGASDTGELSSRTSYTFNNLPEGNNYFRVMVKDSSGNWSEWSDPIKVVVDTIPPTSPSITITY